IVGGSAAPVGRYPYMVSLRDASGSHYCGGSLIAPRVLLTAAHCVADAVHKFPSVHIGRQYLSQAESDYDVRRTVTTAIHGSYDPATSANDIALLRLDAASTKAPLALPTFDLVPANNTPLSVLGFGTTSEGGMYLSSDLQHVTIAYFDAATCQALYPFGQIKPGMLCAGALAGGKDSCQGDSGGPLVLPSSNSASGDLQLGVTSWGYGCARPGLPGVYTSTAHYRSWIN
ncbi:hypothetical protein CHLNCDRAFT_11918, partial [Chlorella variabilis]